jgi:protein-L-isoaspartate(D-aspartate) O-methyltransferase
MAEPPMDPTERAAVDPHRALVDGLVAQGLIRSPAVEAAFRAVPRHPFLPDVPVERVYRDEAIPTRRDAAGVPISSSSQPAAMAIMLEQLEVRPGDRVLEIGAGTGYNAALLARLAGPTGSVVSVDIDEEIVADARRHLAAANVPNSAPITLVRGDGGVGYPPDAPYDRIVLTVGAWDLAPAWGQQFAKGGRLLVPLWLRGAQRTVAFAWVDATEAEPAHLASVSVSSCAFMRLRGSFAGPEGFVALGPDRRAGVTIAVDDRAALDADAVWGHLTGGPREERPVGIAITPDTGWGSLALWLALREPGYCTVHVEDGTDAPPSGVPAIPSLVGRNGSRWTEGLVGGEGLALLGLATEDRSNPGGLGADGERRRGLVVHRFGPDATLADRLASQVVAWDDAGRPGDEGLRIRAYPLSAAAVPIPEGAAVLPKRWHRFVVDWTGERAGR